MTNEEIMVYLRPKTGLNYGKMYCEMLEEYFTLTDKKWDLLGNSKFYEILYKDIERIEDKNYMGIKGVQIYFKHEVNFPSSPSLVLGGLIGGVIGLMKRKKYILYFDSNEEKQLFINRCIEGNNLIEYDNE